MIATLTLVFSRLFFTLAYFKYLEIHLECKLNFHQHIEKVKN